MGLKSHSVISRGKLFRTDRWRIPALVSFAVSEHTEIIWFSISGYIERCFTSDRNLGEVISTDMCLYALIIKGKRTERIICVIRDTFISTSDYMTFECFGGCFLDIKVKLSLTSRTSCDNGVEVFFMKEIETLFRRHLAYFSFVGIT